MNMLSEYEDNTREKLAPYLNKRTKFVGVVLNIEHPDKIDTTGENYSILTIASVYIPEFDIEIDHICIRISTKICYRKGFIPYDVIEFSGTITQYEHNHMLKYGVTRVSGKHIICRYCALSAYDRHSLSIHNKLALEKLKTQCEADMLVKLLEPALEQTTNDGSREAIIEPIQKMLHHFMKQLNGEFVNDALYSNKNEPTNYEEREAIERVRKMLLHRRGYLFAVS